MEESTMNLRRSLSILNNRGLQLDTYQQSPYRNRFDTSRPPPPLLPLPFSASNAALLPVVIKKKAEAAKKRKMKSRRKGKEVARVVDDAKEEEEEEEEEEIVLSPPPSSLPLPRLLLTRRPKATSCFAEADSGTATDDLRRLLRL